MDVPEDARRAGRRLQPIAGGRNSDLDLERRTVRCLVRRLGRSSGRDAQGLDGLPHTIDGAYRDVRDRHLPLACSCELPACAVRSDPRPLLADLRLHAHDPRTHRRARRLQPRPPHPAQLGREARCEAVPRPDLGYGPPSRRATVRGMTTAELMKTRVSDEEVVAWRVEQLLRAGSDHASAQILARRGHVDLHEAVDLLEHGCPPKIALEILL